MRIELIKIRDEKTVKAVLGQMTQLIGSTPPGGQRGAQIAPKARPPRNDRRAVNPQKEEIRRDQAAIARTRDGALLHRYLRRVLEGVDRYPGGECVVCAERATQFGPRPDAAHGRGIE
jgi:hypothetical protein